LLVLRLLQLSATARSTGAVPQQIAPESSDAILPWQEGVGTRKAHALYSPPGVSSHSHQSASRLSIDVFWIRLRALRWKSQISLLRN